MQYYMLGLLYELNNYICIAYVCYRSEVLSEQEAGEEVIEIPVLQVRMCMWYECVCMYNTSICICDLICKNPEQSCIYGYSVSCIFMFEML